MPKQKVATPAPTVSKGVTTRKPVNKKIAELQQQEQQKQQQVSFSALSSISAIVSPTVTSSSTSVFPKAKTLRGLTATMLDELHTVNITSNAEKDSPIVSKLKYGVNLTSTAKMANRTLAPTKQPENADKYAFGEVSGMRSPAFKLYQPQAPPANSSMYKSDQELIEEMLFTETARPVSEPPREEKEKSPAQKAPVLKKEASSRTKSKENVENVPPPPPVLAKATKSSITVTRLVPVENVAVSERPKRKLANQASKQPVDYTELSPKPKKRAKTSQQEKEEVEVLPMPKTGSKPIALFQEDDDVVALVEEKTEDDQFENVKTLEKRSTRQKAAKKQTVADSQQPQTAKTSSESLVFGRIF